MALVVVGSSLGSGEGWACESVFLVQRRLLPTQKNEEATLPSSSLRATRKYLDRFFKASEHLKYNP